MSAFSKGWADESIDNGKPIDSTEPIAFPDRVSRAVERSLPFIESVGVAWMNERGCLSCHHVPFLLWTHRSALNHGLKVDVEKLTEWDNWARKNSLDHRNLFKLPKQELETAKAEDLSAVAKQKLAPIVDRPYGSESDFIRELSKVLSEEELVTYREFLLRVATIPVYSTERDGGGLDVLAELIVSGSPDHVVANADFRGGLLKLIREMQHDDGSWTPGIQFSDMRQWSLDAASQATTMWAVVALNDDRTARDSPLPEVERALRYLRNRSPHANNSEWLATRFLLELRNGTEATIAAAREPLISAQGSDGGWSWFVGGESDPYTTGQALYVLNQEEHGSLAAQIRAGCDYLISRQQADGSWHTPSRKISNTTDPERLRARDEIYHYWGTAWCALGLLESKSIRSTSK